MRLIIKSLIIVFFVVFTGQLSLAQDREDAIKQVKKDVEYLSSDKMKGREAGTKHEKAAADYIAKRFKSIGLSPLGDDGTYIQTFSFPKSKDPHTGAESDEKLEGVNVVGYISNGADNNVIIGAHFDHLGLGGSSSLGEQGEVHNGADDNASGVAAMLYLAETLKHSKYKRNNYIIVSFTGEEKGLYGSNYFMKNPPFYVNTMNYMINLDMVGRLNPEKGIVINGVGTSPIWMSALNNADTNLLKFKTTESGVGPSDQTSFYFKDIPALHFFTGSHEDYHKPSDDADKINFDGIVVISDFIVNIVGDLNGKLKLAFTRTKDEEKSSTPRYKVSLGVIPDYLYDGEGMRIEGVKEDRPAIKAGIRSGDVVVGIGEVEVSNMKTYMEGLATLEEGKKALVKVRRGEKVLEFDVQF